MDNSERFRKLFEDLEGRKQSLGKEADRFPRTKEEYLEKDTEERLGIAKDVLSTYSRVHRHEAYRYKDEWVRTEIKPTDKPEETLVGNVAYRPEQHPVFKEDEAIPEGIGIRVRAYDAEADMYSEDMSLGELRKGIYRDAEGEQHEGWHVWLRGSGAGTVTAVLDSQRGQEMVEFVDTAVIGAIEGVISKHRQFLGGQAVEASSQAVGSSPSQ
jgi:hypothetical protein